MPFTEEQFFEVFQHYNQAVWPAQLLLYGIAITALILAARRGTAHKRYVAALLAVLWAWMALAYHVAFFRQINPAAILFAAFFIAQAALFVWHGAIRQDVEISPKFSAWRVVGSVLIVYGLLLYPFAAIMIGQRYPAMPTFGLPCPTTIFTLGILMWTRSAPVILWIIPVLWALIATQVAIQFGVYEDFGLTLAAAIAIVFLFATRRTPRALRTSGAA